MLISQTMQETFSDITTLTFDVGSTLIESNPDIDIMFHRVACEQGHKLLENEVTVHLDEVNHFYEEEYFKDGDFWCSPEGSVEIFMEMYRYLAHLCGLANSAEEIAHEVNRRYRLETSWAVYKDVIPCLRALKGAHMKLGVISNWSTGLEDLLRGLRLLPYFDSVVASADVGYRKPNPVIFELSLEELESTPAQTIHVGDLIDADGVGAKEIGVTPLIIDRKNRHLSREIAEEYLHVSSLLEIPKLLGINTSN